MGATAPGGRRADTCAVVFAGGDPPPPHALDDLPPDVRVVAADSGLAHAFAAGLHVDLLVGDLDSVEPRAVLAALDAGTEVQRHPSDKDATDLELALEAARSRGAGSVVVVGGHGGRLDHLLANALLLASPRFAELRVDARMGDAHVTVIRDRAELSGAPGTLCSLLPVGGAAIGVETEGLRFPLHHETLDPASTRGISNEFVATVATVSVAAGVLLAVVPQPREDS